VRVFFIFFLLFLRFFCSFFFSCFSSFLPTDLTDYMYIYFVHTVEGCVCVCRGIKKERRHHEYVCARTRISLNLCIDGFSGFILFLYTIYFLYSICVYYPLSPPQIYLFGSYTPITFDKRVLAVWTQTYAGQTNTTG
jgi:hypothetical protein